MQQQHHKDVLINNSIITGRQRRTINCIPLSILDTVVVQTATLYTSFLRFTDTPTCSYNNYSELFGLFAVNSLAFTT